MRYQPLSTPFYVEKRKQFTSQMIGNCIALLTSNDIQMTNADDVMGFAQNNDLFYLCGIDQEDTLLFLYPDSYKEEFREILFIRKTDALTKVWEGDKLSKEQARAYSGVQRIEWIDDFERILQTVAFESDGFYLGHNEHIKRQSANRETRQDRLIAWCKKQYPLHDLHRAAKITRGLRQIKDAEEVEQIKKAAAISSAGFHRVLQMVKPGVKEFEIEAELTYNLSKNGAGRHAFQPIVASGANACALHYNDNDAVCKDGDMILLDFGVCYGNYNSDTTRCLPVSGVFSKRQKEIYSSVLHCLKEGAKLIQPGVLPADYEAQMAKLVEEQLLKLNLITEKDISEQDPLQPAYKKYFMHGTAHHLGLDVHDVGLYSRPFEPGMVVTCEPGIYVPEEGIGCRLENDYLITDDGVVELTSDMPIEINDIERLMAAGKG